MTATTAPPSSAELGGGLAELLDPPEPETPGPVLVDLDPGRSRLYVAHEGPA